VESPNKQKPILIHKGFAITMIILIISLALFASIIGGVFFYSIKKKADITCSDKPLCDARCTKCPENIKCPECPTGQITNCPTINTNQCIGRVIYVCQNKRKVDDPSKCETQKPVLQ